MHAAHKAKRSERVAIIRNVLIPETGPVPHFTRWELYWIYIGNRFMYVPRILLIAGCFEWLVLCHWTSSKRVREGDEQANKSGDEGMALAAVWPFETSV